MKIMTVVIYYYGSLGHNYETKTAMYLVARGNISRYRKKVVNRDNRRNEVSHNDEI